MQIVRVKDRERKAGRRKMSAAKKGKKEMEETRLNRNRINGGTLRTD